jgi:hypothetical protein
MYLNKMIGVNIAKIQHRGPYTNNKGNFSEKKLRIINKISGSNANKPS